MGLLQGSKVYLIGAVDHAEDPRKWRRDITKNLLEPLGVRVYDPLIKPSWFNKEFPQLGTDPSTDFIEFRDLLNGRIKSTEDKQLVNARMKAIRKLCLRMAHDADFIIGSLPKKFTMGTPEELGVAAHAGKPILLHLPDGFDTSTWLPAQIPSFFENSFTTMDKLYKRVLSINSGDVIVDNFEWMFLSYFNNKEVKHEFSNH